MKITEYFEPEIVELMTCDGACCEDRIAKWHAGTRDGLEVVGSGHGELLLLDRSNYTIGTRITLEEPVS